MFLLLIMQIWYMLYVSNSRGKNSVLCPSGKEISTVLLRISNPNFARNLLAIRATKLTLNTRLGTKTKLLIK